MIHKNASIGETKNVIVAEFGNGTLNLQPSQGKDYNSLLVKTTEAHVIGERDSTYVGKSTEEYNPEMALVFRCAESLQVLIDQLEVVKKSFFSKNILYIIAFIFTSCSSDSVSEIPEAKKTSINTHVNELMIGVYNSYYGEKNKGTVTVTGKRVIIQTESYNYDLSLTENKVLIVPDCYILITLQNGDKIKLSFFYEVERVVLWVNKNHVGSFGKNYIIPETPKPEIPVIIEN